MDFEDLFSASCQTPAMEASIMHGLINAMTRFFMSIESLLTVITETEASALYSTNGSSNMQRINPIR